MEVRFAHAFIHDGTSTQAIVEQAARIAEEAAIPDALRERAFVEACRLLGARASVALPTETVHFPLPPGALRGV